MFSGLGWRAKLLCRISNLFLVSLLAQSVSDWHRSPQNAHQPNLRSLCLRNAHWISLTCTLDTSIPLVLSHHSCLLFILDLELGGGCHKVRRQFRRLNRLHCHWTTTQEDMEAKSKQDVHIFYGGNIVAFARITLFASMWSKTTGPVLFKTCRLETMLGVS